MLNLDEDKLTDVTKGARNKILDNIVRLRERHSTLVNIKDELDKNTDIYAKQLNEHLQTMKVLDPRESFYSLHFTTLSS